MTTAAGIRPFRVVEDGVLKHLNMHDGQIRAFESDARFVFLVGGTQVGKTCFGPHWLEREIRTCGPGDYLAITATYPLLKLKMLPEFLYLFDTLHQLGTWREGDKVYTFHDGKTRVIFGSATNPESIESATAQAAWIDECGQGQFKRDAWDAVLRRLSLAQGRILGTTTLYGLTWLKAEVFDKWRDGDEDIEVIQVDSIVNPAFPRAEYERARKTLPQWKFNLFYRGMFDKPAGLIYDAFDEAVCRIKRFNLPDWPRYTGHDFGGVNCAAVWYAQDPGTGYFYAYREYLKGGESAYQHAQEFKEFSKGENVIKRIGGAQHEDGWRESFTAAGWPISKPREKSVEVGINRVYGLHKQNKLFVFDDLHQYLDEKLSYSRKLDDKYEPTEEIADKASYHLMDAERYLVSDFAPETAVGDSRKVYSVGVN